jgi:hypothetical protein
MGCAKRSAPSRLGMCSYFGTDCCSLRMADMTKLALKCNFDDCRKSGCIVWHPVSMVGIWDERRLYDTFKERLCSIFLNMGEK